MFSQEIVDRLRLICPESGQPLSLADSAMVDWLNRAIEEGTLNDLSGAPVEEQIDAALVTEDSGRAYLIFGEIPKLIAGAGIDLAQFDGSDSQ